ncbi:STAS domain-containing protein [uncultured Streptomyces sp.]|uniref:STAS domain-containing protein n=1 Tax=uncultured Streptomyces sp. TaxID=174707 RepID=UPI002620321F|nr:STAS domain-containing protein [uncultured Streptomyces sp.]
MLYTATVVVAEGELDVESLGPLRGRLERAASAYDTVVLDAGGVSFADSSFLTLLLRTHQETPVRVAAASAQVRRLLEITGADQVLGLYPTVEEAMAAAGGS